MFKDGLSEENFPEKFYSSLLFHSEEGASRKGGSQPAESRTRTLWHAAQFAAICLPRVQVLRV